jgi:hypothetical protein
MAKDTSPCPLINMTARYCFHANKLLREYAKSALSPREARTLIEDVSRVRQALGGKNGIWETLQESVGDYVRCEDGTLLRYRKFCEQIFKVEERAWILRVVNFYTVIHERTVVTDNMHVDEAQIDGGDTEAVTASIMENPGKRP